MEKTVIELFAGVGGFRIGLNGITSIKKDGTADENGPFTFVWANQWEPATKTQPAFDCYKKRFNCPDNEVSNEDINKVVKKNIPNHTLLCGGFPCQDYSVARSLKHEKGIQGKKGVLWWDIYDILKAKKPPFVLLENVDRLLKSPSKQRGRDFGIMLYCLSELGYNAEWRVINGADYGHPQRRRRIYIFAFRKNTNYAKTIYGEGNEFTVISDYGIFAKTFPVNESEQAIFTKTIYGKKSDYKDLVEVSHKFKMPFENAGYLVSGDIITAKVTPVKEKQTTLNKIVQMNVDQHYFLSEAKKTKFAYLRGSKKILRIRKPDGGQYYYTEGAMSPVDSLSLPGRTMLTSEGSINRSTHIIKDKQTGEIRILTPIECERLNQFPDDWTSTMNGKQRYFMMGNALICGIIKKLGVEISKIIDNEK
jgi:DNA (cytosine-5)-methyltransferase 1